jgi:hypothetical protein
MDHKRCIVNRIRYDGTGSEWCYYRLLY